MFNVTVLRMKDIMKYLVGLAITLCVVISAARYFSSQKEEGKKVTVDFENRVKMLSENSLLTCLDETIPTIGHVNQEYKQIAEEDEEKKEIHYLQEFLKTEISTMNALEEIEKQEKLARKQTTEEENQNTAPVQETNSSQDLALVQTGVQTEVVTPNPLKESFNVQYGKVKIKNETSYQLTEDMLKPDIAITNKNILLFHTHSCESYTPSEKYNYTQTGTFRTTDLNFSVTRVGTELERYLKQYQFNVIHDTSYHDYPAYNGSYTRSLQTVDNLLKSNQADIIMDVHRDAIGSRSDYAPTVKIGEEYAAQIMYVVGTNGGGLWHPNWNQNLKFAIKVQEKAEEMYPGLFKPMMLTNSRYNQHTGKYASIIEVGATGNTLEQCLTSMKYLANVLNEVTK